MILNFWLFVSRLKIKNDHMTGNVFSFFFLTKNDKWPCDMSHTVPGDFTVQKARQLDWFELAQVTRTACRGSLARTRCTRCWATSVSSDCCGSTHCLGTTTRPSRSLRTSTSTRRSGGLALASLWEAISLCLNSCGFWFCIYFSGGINCSCSFSHRKHK